VQGATITDMLQWKETQLLSNIENQADRSD